MFLPPPARLRHHVPDQDLLARVLLPAPGRQAPAAGPGEAEGHAPVQQVLPLPPREGGQADGGERGGDGGFQKRQKKVLSM